MNKKKKVIIISLIILLVIGAVLTVTIVLNNSSKDIDSHDIKPIDADSYFAENGTVISETKVKDSKDVMSEKETAELLKDRGFTDYSITTEYSMDGEYLDAKDIKESSGDKHPMYYTYYTSKNNEVWTIYVINGSVIAYPANYNMESGKDVEVIISEKDTLISYDNITNKFYETKPKESAAVLKTIEQINSKALDELTKGEIDKL